MLLTESLSPFIFNIFQDWSLQSNGVLMNGGSCLGVDVLDPYRTITLTFCDTQSTQHWKLNASRLVHQATQWCLDSHSPLKGGLALSKCNQNKTTQLWKFDMYLTPSIPYGGLLDSPG